MSVALPSSPAPASATPRLIDFGSVQTPPQGGPAQRLNRIGNRYAIEVQMPTLTPDQRRVFVARLMRGLTEGVIMRFPQPGFSVGTPGSPAVNGSGQTGSTLSLRGLSGGYVIKEGQALSIIVGGRRYLHFAAADIPASGGTAAVPITPMLRVVPGDGAIVEIALPMIEGFLSGNEVAWQVRTDQNADLGFTITEAA